MSCWRSWSFVCFATWSPPRNALNNAVKYVRVGCFTFIYCGNAKMKRRGGGMGHLRDKIRLLEKRRLRAVLCGTDSVAACYGILGGGGGRGRHLVWSIIVPCDACLIIYRSCQLQIYVSVVWAVVPPPTVSLPRLSVPSRKRRALDGNVLAAATVVLDNTTPPGSVLAPLTLFLSVFFFFKSFSPSFCAIRYDSISAFS